MRISRLIFEFLDAVAERLVLLFELAVLGLEFANTIALEAFSNTRNVVDEGVTRGLSECGELIGFVLELVFENLELGFGGAKACASVVQLLDSIRLFHDGKFLVFVGLVSFLLGFVQGVDFISVVDQCRKGFLARGGTQIRKEFHVVIGLLEFLLQLGILRLSDLKLFLRLFNVGSEGCVLVLESFRGGCSFLLGSTEVVDQALKALDFSLRFSAVFTGLGILAMELSVFLTKSFVLLEETLEGVVDCSFRLGDFVFDRLTVWIVVRHGGNSSSG